MSEKPSNASRIILHGDAAFIFLTSVNQLRDALVKGEETAVTLDKRYKIYATVKGFSPPSGFKDGSYRKYYLHVRHVADFDEEGSSKGKHYVIYIQSLVYITR